MITDIEITTNFLFKDRMKTLPIHMKGKQINIIVAPNGFGKSTIFDNIKSTLFEKPVEGINISFTDDFRKNPAEMYFMSSHEINGKTLLQNANPFDNDQYNYSITEGFKRIHLSSGQETKEMLLDFEVLATKANRIIFLDEPELSMDAIELKKFIDIVKKLNNIQIWIISHNPLFVLDDDFNIISLDDNYLIDFKDIYKSVL